MAPRLRLVHPVIDGSGQGPSSAGPIVLFLPAFDEEEAVAGVIGRVPTTVCGRPVRCLVVDDGSGDATAERARAAGAEVVSLGVNSGLGAAVRRGLREGVDRGASVVAFCDADGEYAPEELERLVKPILAGRADYVVGTRFGAGRPCHMRAHRCLGNTLLTRWLAFTVRRPITDGQTGYRALSGRAAAEACIAHDYNYAQVLTIDLLAHGFRYEEVPISYRFRTTGRSFIRVVPYLRNVVPAVYRLVNRRREIAAPVALTGSCGDRSVVDDVGGERPLGRVPADRVDPAGVIERVDGRPARGHGVVRVVMCEQALTSERDDVRQAGDPMFDLGQRLRVGEVVDGVDARRPFHGDLDRADRPQPRPADLVDDVAGQVVG